MYPHDRVPVNNVRCLAIPSSYLKSYSYTNRNRMQSLSPNNETIFFTDLLRFSGMTYIISNIDYDDC